MSNLLKQSNLVGPGFDRSNFFMQAKEINWNFSVNSHTVLNFTTGLTTSFEDSMLASKIIYQQVVAVIPVLSPDFGAQLIVSEPATFMLVIS